MKKELSVTQISRAAWDDFSKEWLSWVLLAAGNIILILISLALHFYMPEYRNILAAMYCFPAAIYTAILHQNGLDAAYGRKLSMIKITPAILFASLFFIAISLYNPFPEYLEFLLFFLPEDFKFLIIMNWIIHIFISYVLVRCMFVGMIILEEKCSVIEAFRKSFVLTSHHLFLMLGLFMYLALALAFSFITVVGYFAVLPYTILVKSLLFKTLSEEAK